VVADRIKLVELIWLIFQSEIFASFSCTSGLVQEKDVIRVSHKEFSDGLPLPAAEHLQGGTQYKSVLACFSPSASLISFCLQISGWTLHIWYTKNGSVE